MARGTNAKEYAGDMIYFEVLGRPFLVLGSLERTTDLLERRSSNYSDRPRLPMVLEMSVGLILHDSLMLILSQDGMGLQYGVSSVR